MMPLCFTLDPGLYWYYSWRHNILSSTEIIPVCISTNSARDSFLHILTNICFLFNDSHPNMGEVSHCSFHLWFSDVNVPFHIPVFPFVCLLWKKMSIQVICPLFNLFIYLFIWRWVLLCLFLLLFGWLGFFGNELYKSFIYFGY